MDPVSAIGLLASISSLLQASKATLKWLKSFKDAQKDLADLINDLSLFEEALKGFDRVFRSRQTKHNISEDVLRKAINDGTAMIKEIERRLTRVYKSEVSALRRVRFVQNKPAFDALCARIQNQCAQMHSFISLAHLETFLAVCNHNPQYLEACSTVVDEMASDPQSSNNPARALPPSTSHSRNSSYSGASLERTTLRESSVASSTLFDSSLSLVRDDGMGSGQSPASDLVGRSADSLIIRRACRYDCYCKCHEQTTDDSSGVFSRLNARIFRERSRPKVECSDPSCAAAISQKKTIPVSVFKKAMSQLMSSNSIKIRYHMNTYRMVPEGSSAIRWIKHGNLEKLKSTIQSGEATLWDTAPDGWSLLHTAAYGRQLSMVQYLVELGAETESCDLGDRKPVDLAFLKAISADATQVEKDLVQVFSKEDDYIDDYEFTSIHIAVLGLYSSSDTERPTLEQLIEFVDNANNAPADTNWARWKSEYQSRSPLYTGMIEQFRVSRAEALDTRKIIHNLTDQKDRKFHWTPLHWSSATGQADKMKILVNNGADPFIRSNLNMNIIHAAVESNALESLSYALEICKCNPGLLDIDQANVWGETPLMVAATGCLVGCVKLLLEAGADRNVRRENRQVALHYAGLSDRHEQRYETVALLSGGNGETELEIDAQDEDGRPPIFDFLDDLECLKILVHHGARLDLLDNAGNSLVHHACIQAETKLVKSLLELSSDVKTILRGKNRKGNTALIEALRHESVGCAMVLLELDDVGEIVGQDGWAAVHYAAKLGHASLLRAVLKHPSFVRGMKTGDGKTARVVAMEAGHWHGDVKGMLNMYNSVA